MKKINIQKCFNFISFLFILSCCLFYGTRFIKLYLENRKEEIVEKNSLVKVIKENNQENENFKIVNGNNYFTGKEENNYLEYSNLLWRIIKINSDNSVTAISDKSVTSLAFGKNTNYPESNIAKWLNKNDKNYSGILENSLNNVEKYLQKTETCKSIYNEPVNTPCNDITSDTYLSLLSISDYLNIGSKSSYLVNEEYFYLSNSNNNKQVWTVDDTGKITPTIGDDIIGVRPVITIKANMDFISGDGTIANPYQIEEENTYFGSYVKLGNDTWRVYKEKDNYLKLILNDYIKINNNNLKYNYSNKNSYFDDYSKNSLAYYLNHTYLNSLPYKDKILEVNWSNGEYNDKFNYDYTTSLNKTINSKVTLISIGDVILNNNLYNYYTMTQEKNNNRLVYTIQKGSKIYDKNINQKLNVVPTICIDKQNLTKGTGKKDNPYEME